MLGRTARSAVRVLSRRQRASTAVAATAAGKVAAPLRSVSTAAVSGSSASRCPFAKTAAVRQQSSSTAGAVTSGVGHLRNTFAACKEEGRPAYVAFMTAGYPNGSVEDSVDILLGMQEGGADVIEVGVPFTDPLADGGTIQMSNQVALSQGFSSLEQVLEVVAAARAAGLTTPVILMGYFNPFLHHVNSKAERLGLTPGQSVGATGYEAALMQDCVEAGVSGFIVVDLPPEESFAFRKASRDAQLSFTPLIAPTTTEARIQELIKCADGFIYAVAVAGVTGARATVGSDLPSLVKRITDHTDLPVAIGFGIGDRAAFENVSNLGEGVVVGSALINALRTAKPGEGRALAKAFCQDICGRTTVTPVTAPGLVSDLAPVREMVSERVENLETNGRFGRFGGRYAPETLVEALDELETEYEKAKNDPEFIKEIRSYDSFIGRPSSLHKAERLTEYAGGARIWLKREDLNHTGAHKINNAVAQALLAKRLGKKRIVAETGAGQHGVATATVCAKLGLELIVYMGAQDVERQALNVFRMEMLGAKVVAVDSGSRTLKDAINEAMRDWVTNIKTTHYLVGSAIGPHPFPLIVRDFQSVIGSESRAQMLEQAGKLPDAVVACVGGGSNAIGMFHPFVNDESVRLVGVEAGGDGINTPRHSSTLSAGTPGVLHGTRTFLLQKANGQITGTHSISAGLDYPGVGPEHAHLFDIHRADYVSVTDREALLGFKRMTSLEGIIPALETSHAIFHSLELAKTMRPDEDLLICVSGRGDKDVHIIRRELPRIAPECKLKIRGEGN